MHRDRSPNFQGGRHQRSRSPIAHSHRQAFRGQSWNRRSRSPPVSCIRSASTSLRRNSPFDRYVQLPVQKLSHRNDPEGDTPIAAPAKPSNQIPLAEYDDELSKSAVLVQVRRNKANFYNRRLNLFFASQNGRPRFSAVCRHENAMAAFIGRVTDPHIKGLEREFPQLRFRKEKVEDGLLIWAELPSSSRRPRFILSSIVRNMLELAAQLLRTYASHDGLKLPNIDDFTRRYFEGQYDVLESWSRLSPSKFHTGSTGAPLCVTDVFGWFWLLQLNNPGQHHAELNGLHPVRISNMMPKHTTWTCLIKLDPSFSYQRR